MANVDRPNGFRVTGSHGGGMRGNCEAFRPEVNLFMGDLTKIDSTGTARGDGGVTALERIADDTSEATYGPVVGWEANPTALTNLYCAAGATYAVYVNTDPTLQGVMQSEGTGIAVTDLGLNCNIAVAAGSTTTGLSNMELADDSEATTATDVVTLLRVADIPGNVVGSSWGKFVVSVNNHYLAAGTAGVG